jgi:hypothetical protein
MKQKLANYNAKGDVLGCSNGGVVHAPIRLSQHQTNKIATFYNIHTSSAPHLFDYLDTYMIKFKLKEREMLHVLKLL